MVEIIKKGNPTIIKLTNDKCEDVYMKYIENSEIDTQLLFINTETLRNYWRRNKYNEWSKYASASEAELRKDYNFNRLEEIFSYGENDPVEVADISVLDHTAETCISITDGFTRTIWLIANDYKIIPCVFRNANEEFLSDEGVYTLKEIIKMFS